MSERKCDSCIHSHVCEKHIHDVWNEFDDCRDYDAERPHGEWEHWGSPFTDDTIANSIVCSLCKARYVEIEDEVFNFCPNCGAPMTEEAFRKYNGLKEGERE